MGKRFHTFWMGVAVASLLVVLAVPGEAREWKVQGRVEGKESDKAKDVSGIACITEAGFPRKCLVIDDEVQWAQVVIVHEDRIVAGQTIQLIDDTYGGKPLELDGEGVAFADGYFYVMGSHGRPRKKIEDTAKLDARIKASSQLIRIRLGSDDISPEGHVKPPAIKATAKLREALANHPKLKAFANRELDDYGLTIEGVAIRNGILYAGLRAPLLDGRAVVASVPVSALFDETSGVPNLTLHSLTIGPGNGIRDLVVCKGEFIVLAGSALALNDEEAGRYSLYRWTGAGDVTGSGVDVPVYPKQKGDKSSYPKPEAILPLEQTQDGLRMLVIYEGAEEGRPRDFTFHWK